MHPSHSAGIGWPFGALAMHRSRSRHQCHEPLNAEALRLAGTYSYPWPEGLSTRYSQWGHAMASTAHSQGQSPCGSAIQRRAYPQSSHSCRLPESVRAYCDHCEASQSSPGSDLHAIAYKSGQPLRSWPHKRFNSRTLMPLLPHQAMSTNRAILPFDSHHIHASRQMLRAHVIESIRDTEHFESHHREHGNSL